MEEWYGQVAPREKLLKYGAAVLTDAELLAIFLRTGIPGMHVMQMAEYLIEEFGSLYGLISADYQALCAKKGIGVSKYSQIQAIAELAGRCFSSHLMQESVLQNPEITQKFLQNILSHREREIFLVMFLDNQLVLFAMRRCLLVPSVALRFIRGKLCVKRLRLMPPR